MELPWAPSRWGARRRVGSCTWCGPTLLLGVQCWPREALDGHQVPYSCSLAQVDRKRPGFNLFCPRFLPAHFHLDSPPQLWRFYVISETVQWFFYFLFSCLVNSPVLLSAAVEAAPLLPAKPPQPLGFTEQSNGCVWGAQWH